jgi:hypothetical protein
MWLYKISFNLGDRPIRFLDKLLRIQARSFRQEVSGKKSIAATEVELLGVGDLTPPQILY